MKRHATAAPAVKKETVMFISPVQRESVQGRGQYSYIKPDGTAIPAGRTFAKGVDKRYSFPQTLDGTHIKTGLERMVSNPWYERDAANINAGLPEHFHVGSDWMNSLKEFVNDEQITKQRELEIRFNLPENYLTSKKQLDARMSRRKPDDEASFLEKFYIVLYDRPNRFDDTTLRSALAMELAKSSQRIADNKSQANPSRHHFYISEENEAAIERAEKQDVVNDAVTDLTLLRRNHNLFLRYQIATILKLVKGVVAPVIVKDSLNDYIMKSSKEQINNIKHFNRIVDMINDGQVGLSKLWIEYLVQQAVNANIFSTKGGQFIWHSKKGIDNLHNLGSHKKNILKMFHDEFIKYQDDDETENFYKDLIVELKSKGVKLEE